MPANVQGDPRLTLSVHGYKLEAAVIGLVERLLNEVEHEMCA